MVTSTTASSAPARTCMHEQRSQWWHIDDSESKCRVEAHCSPGGIATLCVKSEPDLGINTMQLHGIVVTHRARASTSRDAPWATSTGWGLLPRPTPRALQGVDASKHEAQRKSKLCKDGACSGTVLT